MGTVQWGDVATWVGGIATAIALILTYVLLLITRREQVFSQVEKRQAQARLVSAWTGQAQPESGNSKHSVTVTLQNSSDEPVYNLRAAIGAEWSGTKIEFTELELYYVLPPKTSEQKEVVFQFSRLGPDAATAMPVELLFRDATGKRWHRDRYGSLIQITQESPLSGEKLFFKTSAKGG